MPDESRIDQRGQKVIGPRTNIAGEVNGPVLSGQFDGPVAPGGEAADFRGSTGALYKPTIQQYEKPPVPSQIPAPPRDFTGRKEEIDDLLAGFKSGATITGLRSLGGIGKTALALVLADRLRAGFPDGQIFINLLGTRKHPLNPADAMAHVIRSYLGADARLPEDPGELAGLYRSVLSGKKALLLLDNAASREQVEPLLPPSSGTVLVTSRKKFTLPGMSEPFSLDTLKPAEASDLLLKICPRIGSHAEQLAKLCGYLPLALRSAASLLAVESDLNPSSYLNELRSERTRLEKIGKEGVDLDMEASLDLSYSRLPAETASVFRKLSVFPSDFDAAAEEVVCQDEGHRHLSELVRWSLVEYERSEKEGAGRYHLHDLVRIFAASHLQDEEDDEATAKQHHAEYYRNVLSSSKELYKQGGENVMAGLMLFDKEQANILAGQAWAEKNLQGISSAADLCNTYPNAGVYVLDLRLHPRIKIRWLETALVAARQLGNRDAEGSHLGNLGSAYAELGDARRAIEYYEQRLAIARETGDRGGKGNALGNLGNAYAALGDARRAIEYYEQHLAIACEIGDRRGEGNALGNLGLAFAALGDAYFAIDYYEQALEIAREIGDQRIEGTWLGNLGNAYYDLGDARQAIEYYEQALAISREIGDRRIEATWLGNLGLAYDDLSDARQAIDCYEQAIKIGHEIGDQRVEGNAIFNMSLALDSLGKRSEAVKLARDALAIYERIESPYAERVRLKLAEWHG